MFISHWLQPCKSGIEACAAASLQALGAGDMESASMCRHLKLVLSFWGGVELPACEKEAAECIRLHERCGQEWFRKANAAMWHSLCALTGNHDRLADVWGGPFDMADYESASLQVGDKGALAVHHTLEMAFHVILGDVEEAEKHTAGLASNLEAIVSSPFHSAAIFFEALCLLAGARKRSGLTGREKRRIRGHRALLARWAGRCEIGFKHRRLLVEAEWERTTNPGPGTLTRYAEAIAAAQESKVVSEEALANELAGRYLVDLGMSKAAAPYLAQARYVFGQWGAAEKVRLLDEEFGALTARAESASAAWRAETLGSTMKESSQRTGGELDLASLLKSSRAISGEIVLDRLIQTTMGIVVENAGAQRGLFILKRESGWQVEAEIDVGAAQAAAPPPAPLPLGEANRDRPRLALGIVNYVLNSGRAVVLGDAAREGEFQSDEYVRTRRPKSILCTATRFRGTVGGIIYLENNDATQVFTEERVEVIDVLTSQIAVSLENALLFKAKEDVIAAYERFVPRQFLGYLGKRSILDVSLGDQTEREMTVLFSDIREFTSLSERMTPAENFEFINSYLSVMEPVIHSHGGFIDKYVGDAIMALFPTGPDDALAASMEMVRLLARLNSVRSGPGIQPIRIGIGLNSGRLMLGTVGGKDRMDGTVISDAVNLASRVEGMTKVFGATILASEHTFVGLKEGKRQPHRALGTVRVKGKSRPVTVFEFFGGEAEEQVALKLRTGDDFATAVQAYVSKRFIEADALFRSIVAQNPADRAAAAYLKRCRHYQDFGVPDDWNGVADLGSD
jgi:class 3 adenylate cyclase/GAF domain-containing protein